MSQKTELILEEGEVICDVCKGTGKDPDTYDETEENKVVRFFTFECPKCGALVTFDMAQCPACGVLFEGEGEIREDFEDTKESEEFEDWGGEIEEWDEDLEIEEWDAMVPEEMVEDIEE